MFKHWPTVAFQCLSECFSICRNIVSKFLKLKQKHMHLSISDSGRQTITRFVAINPVHCEQMERPKGMLNECEIKNISSMFKYSMKKKKNIKVKRMNCPFYESLLIWFATIASSHTSTLFNAP